MEFCRAAGAGGNHLVVVTPGGNRLSGSKNRGHVFLRERDLAPILEEFRRLPEEDRRPVLPDPTQATPPKRPVPDPPENGLIIRGYCTYMNRSPKGVAHRVQQHYYKENPDAWAAETQSDMLWLTESEWKSLIPDQPGAAAPYDISAEIQRRFFSTLGIDYMEGSVNALPVRESKLTLQPLGFRDGKEALKITGFGKMGEEVTEDSNIKPRTRGCEVEVSGLIHYDPKTGKISAFDLIGIGKAWGNKMNYTKRAIRIAEHPWHFGIACELVTGRSPCDLVPPYNMLHYGGGMKYFGDQPKN